MGKFPSPNTILTWVADVLRFVWQFLKKLIGWLRMGWEKMWIWLRLRLPFLEALVQRHVENPATIFIDFAIFILSLYLIFGATGAFMIYRQKAENRVAETLTTLYPLPAVKVENSFVWSHRFLQRLRFLNTFQAQAPKDVAASIPSDQQLREKVIAGLVEDKIIFLEAQKRGISVSRTEIDSSYDQQRKATDNFEKRIKEMYGMRPQEFKDVLAERILKEKVKANVVTRVRVRHILTSTESAAADARRQMVAGKSFDQAAKEFSQDNQTKNTGGDLGYWTKGELASQISQAFEDEAFNQTVYGMSQPVQSKFGYHILQVTEHTGNNYQTYEEWYAGAKNSYSIKIYLPL